MDDPVRCRSDFAFIPTRFPGSTLSSREQIVVNTSLRGRRVRRGFTIVEMMAVLGVIVVLVAIIVPTIRTARLGAMNATDLSQMRQLGMAHLAFQAVNSDKFVDVGLPHGGYGDEARSFAEVLRPYSDDVVMKSPLDDSRHWPSDLGGEGLGVAEDGSGPLRRTSYGMNNYLSSHYSPAVAMHGPGHAADRVQKVRFPDRIVCFLHMARSGDFAVSDHPHVENWGIGTDPARLASQQVTIWAAEGSPLVDPLASSNYGFVDGSIGTRRFEEVYESYERNAFDPELEVGPPAG